MAEKAGVREFDLCPTEGCKALVSRTDSSRWEFCTGKCGVLLNIPARSCPSAPVRIITHKNDETGGKETSYTREDFEKMRSAVHDFSLLAACPGV